MIALARLTPRTGIVRRVHFSWLIALAIRTGVVTLSAHRCCFEIDHAIDGLHGRERIALPVRQKLIK